MDTIEVAKDASETVGKFLVDTTKRAMAIRQPSHDAPVSEVSFEEAQVTIAFLTEAVTFLLKNATFYERGANAEARELRRKLLPRETRTNVTDEDFPV